MINSMIVRYNCDKLRSHEISSQSFRGCFISSVNFRVTICGIVIFASVILVREISLRARDYVNKETPFEGIDNSIINYT